jgi:hypothetical protein
MAKVCDIDRHPATDNINIGYEPAVDPGHYAASSGRPGEMIDVCVGCLTAFSDKGFKGLLDRHDEWRDSQVDVFDERGGY